MATILDPLSATKKKHYPNWKVIVKNDDYNTFQHVTESFIKVLPEMSQSKAKRLAYQIHHEGLAVVWKGALEQAEMYHVQLSELGLTMAPLEQE